MRFIIPIYTFEDFIIPIENTYFIIPIENTDFIIPIENTYFFRKKTLPNI